MTYDNEAIICIVNTGFSDTVMDAARRRGARGGTVIRARGTADRGAEQFFGITVSPEKEIILILTDKQTRDPILHEIYSAAGLDTPGQGIAFSIPVDAAVGLSAPAEDTGK